MVQPNIPRANESDEILYQSATTRVFRTGSSPRVICKRPLDANAARRLHHEREILARLAGVDGVAQLAPGEHRPDVLALKDFGGVSLAQRLRTRRLEMPTVLHLAQKLARTLGDVHRAGIVHRDINPSNILIAADGNPVLIDFDAASGVEQHPMGLAADLHAFGVTLCQMATGRLPADSRGSVAPPQADDGRVPPGPSGIILRLLAKTPEHRYQSADGVFHDLQRLSMQLLAGSGGTAGLGECD